MEETWIKLHYSEHDSMLIKTFAIFCEKEDYLDVTFACNNGKKVLASKLVLSCISPFLKSLLSEWEGNDEMITLLLPGIDHNILKLILDFVYEGITKLSENEYKDFMQLLQMLQIVLPGATVIERNVLSAPQNPPPPVAKLQKKTVTMNANNSMEKKSDTENDKRENSSTAEEKPRRRSSEPDDDPLNVPDYYYVPSTLTGGNNQAHSKNTANLKTNNMREVRVKSDLNVDTHQEANNSSTLQQDGKSTRKRTYPQSNLEKERNVAKAKRSLGRKSSALDREGGTDVAEARRSSGRKSSALDREGGTDVAEAKRSLGRKSSALDREGGTDVAEAKRSLGRKSSALDREGGTDVAEAKRSSGRKSSALDREGGTDVAEAKRSLGRKSSTLDREGGTDFSGNARKRLCASTSFESDNSLDIPTGTEPNRRKQSFAYMRDDSYDTVILQEPDPRKLDVIFHVKYSKYTQILK